MSQLALQERLATRIGLHPAILLMKVRAWTKTNEKNGKPKKDGRCWMYNSIAAWHVELPYLSEKQIRTSMTYLRKNGYLLAEKAKKHQWNQTLHYALTDLALEVFQEIEAQNDSVPMDSTHSANESAAQDKPLCPDSEIDLPSPANDTNALPNALPCNEMIPSPSCSEVIPHDVFMGRLEAWNISEAEMRDFLDRTGRPEAWAYQWLGIMEEDIRSGRVSEYRSPFGALMERHKGNWPFPRAVRSADLPETKALQKAVETTRCRMLEELESINPDPTTSPFWKLHQKYMAPVPIVT
jgi:hypothetical protein